MFQRAEQAAQLWPLTVNTLGLAAHRENAVFKLEAEEGTFALRLHRTGYRDSAELEAELAFMAMLASTGIAVPAPLRSRTGKHVETLSGQHASLLTWLSGSPLGKTGMPLAVPDRAGTFRRFGRLIAELHTAADNWTPPQTFKRQAWDIDGLLGPDPQWGRFWENPSLTMRQKDVLLQAREKLRSHLSSHDFDTGLIHADLVCENILIDGDTIQIIDFDDFGPGYRLQDMATALVKFEAEPDFADLREELCSGYESLRPLDRRNIDTFLLIRHLSYVGWIVPRLEGEHGQRRCQRFIDNVMPIAESFLSV